MSTGRCGPPLLHKLGARPGHRILLVNAPAGFAARLASPDVTVELAPALAPGARADLLVLWLKGDEDLAATFSLAEKAIFPDGAVWIVIPRKATPRGKTFPFDFAAVQAAGLRTTLVDVKDLKFTDEEYGVRFVVRKEHRKAK